MEDDDMQNFSKPGTVGQINENPIEDLVIQDQSIQRISQEGPLQNLAQNEEFNSNNFAQGFNSAGI